jgi:hypothetical protein
MFCIAPTQPFWAALGTESSQCVTPLAKIIAWSWNFMKLIVNSWCIFDAFWWKIQWTCVKFHELLGLKENVFMKFHEIECSWTFMKLHRISWKYSWNSMTSWKVMAIGFDRQVLAAAGWYGVLEWTRRLRCADATLRQITKIARGGNSLWPSCVWVPEHSTGWPICLHFTGHGPQFL